jgi:hypothetical protein
VLQAYGGDGRRERELKTAIRYTMAAIKISPNIVRMSGKFGESGSTNNAGTKETIAIIASEIQCGMGRSAVLKRALVESPAD